MFIKNGYIYDTKLWNDLARNFIEEGSFMNYNPCMTMGELLNDVLPLEYIKRYGIITA